MYFFKMHKLILIVILLFVGSHLLLADTRVLTNLELLDTVIEEVAVDILQKYQVHDSDTLQVIQIEDPSPLAQYIQEHLLLQWGKNHNLKVFVKQGNFSEYPTLFLLPPAKSGVIYQQIITQGFWRKSMIERNAFLDILIRFQKPGESAKSYKFSGLKNDIVPLRMKHYIEQQGMILGPVLMPEKKKHYWIETFLALTVTSVIVYLFYTIRSE